MYKLDRIQHLDMSLEEAWAFFSNPSNLAVITPDDMSFHIKDPVESMYEGMCIRYTVSPFKGVKIDWTTHITKVEENRLFIDEQVQGPYSYWHHEHHFKPTENGVEMRDILYYQLPFGPLGKLLHRPLVKKRLDTIFDFRYKKIEELFGTAKSV